MVHCFWCSVLASELVSISFPQGLKAEKTIANLFLKTHQDRNGKHFLTLVLVLIYMYEINGYKYLYQSTVCDRKLKRPKGYRKFKFIHSPLTVHGTCMLLLPFQSAMSCMARDSNTSTTWKESTKEGNDFFTLFSMCWSIAKHCIGLKSLCQRI